MPTVTRIGGFRFFFFSNERDEPPHIHVEAAGRYAKFWVAPVSLAASANFRSHELTELRRIVLEQSDFLKEKWDEFFGSQAT